MALGTRDIKIKFTGDTSGLSNASASGQKELSKWQSGFEKFNRVAVPAALAVGGAALVVVKDAITLSRTITDLDTKAKTVFGGQLGVVNRWANNNKRAFGLSRRETVGLAANFADLLKPMGFTTQEAAKMSTNVVGLSGALAKWSGNKYNAAEVSEILSKAMLGERDQLKSLGISISEADVQARLAAKGQEKLTGAALQQAKAIATQELIMEKSTDAQRAWANGGRRAAVAQNGMKSSIMEVRESLAVALAPAIKQGTALLSKLAKWVAKNRQFAFILGGVLVGLAGAVFAVNAAVKVWRAATVVMTAAQWALNVALRANPIGLVITALVALGAGLVILWKKSETFRRIVKGAWNAVKSGAIAMKNGVVAAWNWIRSSIGSAVNGIRGFLSGMWDGMVSGARSAVNAAIGIINGAIGGINTLINGINYLPGVSIPNVPSIPYLAKGGVITAPTLAVVGEGPEPEAVMPLSKLGAMLDQAAGNGGTIVIKNYIEVGGEVARVVRQEIRRDKRGLRRGVVAA